MVDNHPFSWYRAGFLLGNFFSSNVPAVYVFQLNHKPAVPQMGVMKMDF